MTDEVLNHSDTETILWLKFETGTMSNLADIARSFGNNLKYINTKLTVFILIFFDISCLTLP